jgi:hypothetical protein
VDNALQTPAALTDHSVSEPEQKPQTDGASSLSESGDKAVVEREIGTSANAVEDTAGQTEDMKEEQHRGEREGESLVSLNCSPTNIFSEMWIDALSKQLYHAFE